MQVTFKASFTHSAPPETSANGKTYQRVYFQTPARRDDFGAETYPAETFEVVIYGEDFRKKFFAGYKPDQPEQRAEVICYLNSKAKQVDNKTFYNLTLSFKAVNWI